MSWCIPKPKRCVVRDVAEIPVGRHHDQFVPMQKLREQRINGSDLNAVSAAFVAQADRGDMVVARRHNHDDVSEQDRVHRRLRSFEILLLDRPFGHQQIAVSLDVRRQLHPHSDGGRKQPERLFRETCGQIRRRRSLCYRYGPSDDAVLTPAQHWLRPDGFVRPVGTLAG